jgi:hypothetical protein
MSLFVLRLLRTLNAIRLGNESALRQRPTGRPPPVLRGLSQRRR